MPCARAASLSGPVDDQLGVLHVFHRLKYLLLHPRMKYCESLSLLSINAHRILPHCEQTLVWAPGGRRVRYPGSSFPLMTWWLSLRDLLWVLPARERLEHGVTPGSARGWPWAPLLSSTGLMFGKGRHCL